MNRENTISTESLTLIDTHCHLNIMVKEEFDTPLFPAQVSAAQAIIGDAIRNHVTTIINVGTSLAESINSVTLAQQYKQVFATIGIHPTDCTSQWQPDLQKLQALLIDRHKNKIVGIGECGIDLYHPGHNLQRQTDAFKAHIELALEYNLALVIHSRNAAQETLKIIDSYKRDIKRATMHCFSYDQSIANDIIAMGYMIGIDAPITYKKNEELRTIAATVPLEYIVLETDAPFLPPQEIRGQQNHPKYIKTIAQFIAELRNTTLEHIAAQTTINARALFNLDEY